MVDRALVLRVLSPLLWLRGGFVHWVNKGRELNKV